MVVVLRQILHYACSVASNVSFRLAVRAYRLVAVWVLIRAQGALMAHRLGMGGAAVVYVGRVLYAGGPPRAMRATFSCIVVILVISCLMHCEGSAGL